MRFISVIERELGTTANMTMTDMSPGDVLSTYADISHANERLGASPEAMIMRWQSDGGEAVR